MLKSRLIYLGIILTSFIFSQALYESVSFMTFVIVLILPIISIFFALVVYPFISVRIITNGSNVRRLDEFVIRVVIKGVCPFISPAMKITCSVPDENGYEIKKTIFAASPSFLIKSYFDYTCKLVNRGTYTLKVDSIEYYDFLKLVKIKKKFKKSLKVNVQPRKIKVDIPVAYEQYNQDNTYILGENTNASVGDMVGVRDYVMGDNLKNVHWKLSSKSEELITKTYAEDICDKAYIIVDMSAYYEEHFINKSMTDCVVELALCAVEEYAKTSVRFGVVLSEGKGAYKRYSVSNPNEKAAASIAVANTHICADSDIVEFLNGIDFNLLSGSEVLIVTSFRSTDVLKDVKKIFIDKKVKLNIINVVDTEPLEKTDTVTFTREFLETRIKGIK